MFRFTVEFWLFLLPLPVALWWLSSRLTRPFQRRADTTALAHPNAALIGRLATQQQYRRRPPWWWLAGCMGIIFALARPQWFEPNPHDPRIGHEMILALDISTSMRAVDFTIDGNAVNRLNAVRSLVQQFIAQRTHDRIGLIIFGDDAFTLSPPTSDHSLLDALLDEVQLGLAGEKTALGDAIALAVQRLANAQSNERLLIVFSDGANTAGTFSPHEALQLAKLAGVQIYTVGVGNTQPVAFPGGAGGGIALTQLPLDDTTLRLLATQSGGRYFNATNTTSLASILREIDQRESVQLNVELPGNYTEWYWLPLILGILALLLSYWYGSARIAPGV